MNIVTFCCEGAMLAVQKVLAFASEVTFCCEEAIHIHTKSFRRQFYHEK
jgi:hypothetical protein